MSKSLIATPGTLRPMMRLALPVLAEQVLHLLVHLVDLWLTGNFLEDEAYVAAITLVFYALWVIANLFEVVAIGSTALVARFVGAGDRPLANRVMNQSILAGSVWAGMLMLVTLPTVGTLVALMGLDGTAAAAAERYLLIELAVLPAVMIERVGIACLRGAGDMVSGLVTMGVVNVINMVVSYALLVGWGGLPELGWTGIALGTAVGHVCGALIILALLMAGRAGFHLRPAALWPNRELIRRILKIGIPGGIDTLMITGCHMVYLRIVLGLGDIPAAAHGVAVRIEALGYIPGGAFQIAAATLTGQFLGGGDPARARRGALTACAAACTVMLSAGVVFFTAATPLAAFFLGGTESDVVPLAARLLKISAIVMLPMAIMSTLIGALRGAGDTRWPLAITLLGFVALRIPLAYYFAYDELTVPWWGESIHGLGLGVLGAWYGSVADIVTRCLLLIARFQHGGWQRIEV